jgi:alkanesulfonate monooxygenase SsuD/methylene tetrahydromethanopterin reductase-like flavin-dependent oxidoreductase (luciferase family)
VDFHGEYYQVSMELPTTLAPVKTPIPISALSVNAFRLAGEIADGAISWIAPVPYLVSTALPALAEGAERGDRDVPPLIGHVPVAISNDRDAVREAGMRMFGSYGRLPFYANMFEAAGFPVENGRLTHRTIDELVVSGTPEEVRTRLETIQAEGITELLISSVPVENAQNEFAELAGIITD